MVQLNSFHAVVWNTNVVRVIKRILATLNNYIMSYIEALNVELFDAIMHALYVLY